MKKYKTEQEEFWAGEFGQNYISRNNSQELIASNISLFAKIISKTTSIQSIIEFGANIGLNLQALRQLLPNTALSAIEINQKAIEELNQFGNLEIFHKSILELSLTKTYDFTFIKGVLIHINPHELPTVYEKLYNASNKYICLIEYYNPSPIEIPYRGYSEKLFKRDFAGEMLEKYSDLELLDYGFVYHRDNNFPQDDLTWFLLEKK
jgi:spore coat polysaccharide biosynthesis protein SpsF